jgi:hypothetical protein
MTKKQCKALRRIIDAFTPEAKKIRGNGEAERPYIQ